MEDLSQAPESTGDTADTTVSAVVNIQPHVRFIDVVSEGWTSDKSLANAIAVYEDGQCLVAKDHANNPDVRALLQTIEAKTGRPLKRIFGSLEEVSAARRTGIAGRRGSSETDMEKTILDLIEDAHRANASDIHVEVGTEITNVTFRIDGRLVHSATWSVDKGIRFLGAAYTMADVSDGSFSPALFLAARIAPREGAEWRFPEGLEAIRMQSNPLTFGRNYGVFRLLRTSRSAETLESLGYEPEQLPLLTSFTYKSKGMAIFSGPTGSGKSTTMCALLESTRKLDQASGNNRALFTIEDPPERRLPGAQQLTVPNTKSDEDRARAYADAIRAAMRSDPDIIMIGEMRDRTTANLGVGASMTGHQVWSTLHCATAHAIPQRLIDLGVERSKIFGSDELYIAVAQVLVPVLCKHCRVDAASESARTQLDNPLGERLTKIFGKKFYVAGRNRACPVCSGTGVKGRTVLAEVVRTDAAYLDALKTGIAAAREFSRARGEPSISDVGYRKVLRGEVSPLDVARVADLDEMESGLLNAGAAEITELAA